MAMHEYKEKGIHALANMDLYDSKIKLATNCSYECLNFFMDENHSSIGDYARFSNHRQNAEIITCENAASNTSRDYLSPVEFTSLSGTLSEQVNKLYDVATSKQVRI